VVDDQAVEAPEALVGDCDEIFGQTRFGGVTGNDFDAVAAVFLLQLL
jgi:hypothetical protein